MTEETANIDEIGTGLAEAFLKRILSSSALAAFSGKSVQKEGEVINAPTSVAGVPASAPDDEEVGKKAVPGLIKKSLKKIIEDMSKVDGADAKGIMNAYLGSLSTFADDQQEKVKEVLGKVQGMVDPSNQLAELSKLQDLVGTGIDTDLWVSGLAKIKTAGAEVGKLLSKELGIGKLAALAMGKSLSDLGLQTLEKGLKPARDFQEMNLKHSKVAIDIDSPFAFSEKSRQGQSGEAHSYKQGKNIKAYENAIIEAKGKTLAATEEIQGFWKAISGAGVDKTELTAALKSSVVEAAKLKSVTGEFNDQTGIVRLQEAIHGLGMSSKEGADFIAQGSRVLGLSYKESATRLGVLAEIARITNEPIGEITNVINKGTESMKFFGDSTKGTSDIYTKFLTTLGDGKGKLAGEFTEVIVTGLTQMNEGLAAFIGQASGIGNGALGSVLEIEQKLESGDTQEIMDAITDQIESISGSSLMSRQEAIDTGQEDTFFMQRKLLSEFGFGKAGEEKTNDLLEALAAGKGADTVQINAARGLETAARRGQEKRRGQTNLADEFLDKTTLSRDLKLTSNIAAKLRDSTGTVQKIFNRFGEGLEEIIGSMNVSKSAVSSKVSADDIDDIGKNSLASTLSRRVLWERAQENGGRGDLATEAANETRNQMDNSGKFRKGQLNNPGILSKLSEENRNGRDLTILAESAASQAAAVKLLAESIKTQNLLVYITTDMTKAKQEMRKVATAIAIEEAKRAVDGTTGGKD